MRRFLLAIGLLLIPLPASAGAFSPWVQLVIDRAEAGIATAGALPSGGTQEQRMTEIEENRAKINHYIMTTRDLAMEAQVLREKTVCFENDRVMLERELTRIRDEMEYHTMFYDIAASKVLRSVYEFTAGAYYSLLKGGDDSTYKDNLLRFTYPWESVTLWNQADQPAYDSGSTLPLCPYTTEYSPHFYGYILTPGTPVLPGLPTADIRSYGCDWDPLWSLPVAELWREADNQINFMDQAWQFSSSTYSLISNALLALPGNAWTLPPPFPPMPHEKMDGCLRPIVPSHEEINSPNGTFWPGFLETLFLAFPGSSDKEITKTDAGSRDQTFSPPPEQQLPVGLIFRNTFDYFQTDPNSTILIRSFADRREDTGRARPFPVELTDNGFSTFFTFMSRNVNTLENLTVIQSNTERQMAYYDAWDRDATEKTAAALAGFTSAVDSLTEVVQEDFPKEYIPDLVYFLMRSCVDGACKQTLDSVMKRTFNKYCYPYASGLYKDEETYKKCYCQGSYDSENYCSGGPKVDPSGRSSAPWQCGEPPPAGTP